jgi:hypothetical protein
VADRPAVNEKSVCGVAVPVAGRPTLLGDRCDPVDQPLELAVRIGETEELFHLMHDANRISAQFFMKNRYAPLL